MTTPTTDPTTTLCALSERLRIQAKACEYEATLLIAQAARETQRATLLRREADRVQELSETTPEAPR